MKWARICARILAKTTPHFFIASDRAGHYRFDLPGYVAQRLRKKGLISIHDLALCTYPPENGLFSYRRTTHRGEADYGRELSAILLDIGQEKWKRFAGAGRQ